MPTKLFSGNTPIKVVITSFKSSNSSSFTHKSITIKNVRGWVGRSCNRYSINPASEKSSVGTESELML